MTECLSQINWHKVHLPRRKNLSLQVELTLKTILERINSTKKNSMNPFREKNYLFSFHLISPLIMNMNNQELIKSSDTPFAYFFAC